MFWLSAAKWIGTGAGVSGAVLIALHLGIVVYGFALFLLSSLLWGSVALIQREPSLAVLQGAFTAINLLGLWRWAGAEIVNLKRIRGTILVLILFAATPVLGQENQIVGVASVIDGDTIEIHGQRIRLFGIDAPKSSQLYTAHWRAMALWTARQLRVGRADRTRYRGLSAA